MVLADATTGLIGTAADMRLLSIVAKAILTKKGNTHIAAPSWMLLVTHIILTVARNPIIEIELLGWKKCAFKCNFTFFIILDI